MTDMSEIVGEDVNLAPESEAPEQIQEAPAETTEKPAGEEAPAEVETVEEVRAKTVPLAALHEAREKIRIQRQEFDQLKAEQARRDQIIEQRLAALVQAQQPQAPTFEDNPAEHLRHQLQEVQQTQQLTQQQVQEFHQAQQRAAAEQQLSSMVVAHEQEFAAQAPDYHEALAYMRQARVRELQVFGVETERAMQQANQELRQHAFWAAAHGHNPAEMAYKIAESRGYSRKPVAPSAAEKLQVQQRGVSASRSLGSGGAATGKPSVEALLSMSDDDFAAATKGNNWQKLIGG